jgi:glycosyltransferase involved in cell wall biosynthesis
MSNGVQKVLFVNSWSTAHGGSSTSLIDVVTNLDPNRYAPVVICPEEGDLPIRLREVGVRVLVRGIHRPTREEFHRFAWEVPRHWAWLRRERIALVHGNTSASRRSIVQAAASAGIPYVQHVRNVVTRPQKNYGYQVAARIMCNSDATAAVFRQHAPFRPKTVTLYNAVDLSRYDDEADDRREDLGLAASRPIVGFVGQLVPRKGVTTLIRAMADVVRHKPEAFLAIVGCAPPDETEYEAECRRLVGELGLQEHVRFVGYRRDVPAWMRTFDVFALPTRSEPFGKVVIEAMAAGCPVVASRVGGIPEILTSPDLGTLIEPDDPDVLSTAILNYLTDEGRRRAVAARGAASARERFGMPSMMRRLQSVYDELLNIGRRPAATSAQHRDVQEQIA